MIELEDAPFSEYLRILRENNREVEADKFEAEFTALFAELGYTPEDLYNTSVKNVFTVIEKYLNEVNKQILSSVSTTEIGGSVLVGNNVDPELVKKVSMIQSRRHEEEKNRLMMG